MTLNYYARKKEKYKQEVVLVKSANLLTLFFSSSFLMLSPFLFFFFLFSWFLWTPQGRLCSFSDFHHFSQLLEVHCWDIVFWLRNSGISISCVIFSENWLHLSVRVSLHYFHNEFFFSGPIHLLELEFSKHSSVTNIISIPGNLLELQILRPHPVLLNKKPRDAGLRNLFYQLPGDSDAPLGLGTTAMVLNGGSKGSIRKAKLWNQIGIWILDLQVVLVLYNFGETT